MSAAEQGVAPDKRGNGQAVPRMQVNAVFYGPYEPQPMRPEHESLADAPEPNEGRRLMLRPGFLVGTGVVFIFGGETFCILGPMRYEAVVHVVCHAILYSGMGLVGLGAVLHWVSKHPTRSGGPRSRAAA